MCGADTPDPAPALPEAPRLPDENASKSGGGDRDKRRRARSSSTLLTSSAGVTSTANTAGKQLLGA